SLFGRWPFQSRWATSSNEALFASSLISYPRYTSLPSEPNTWLSSVVAAMTSSRPLTWTLLLSLIEPDSSSSMAAMSSLTPAMVKSCVGEGRSPAGKAHQHAESHSKRRCRIRACMHSARNRRRKYMQEAYAVIVARLPARTAKMTRSHPPESVPVRCHGERPPAPALDTLSEGL